MSKKSEEAAAKAAAKAATPAPSPAPAEAAKDGAKSETILNGSSTLPALMQIGGVEVQLGSIVSAAFEVSGLTVESWNALDEDKRDELLNAHIALLETEAKAAADTAAKAASDKAAADKAEADKAEADAAAAKATEAAAHARAMEDRQVLVFPRTVKVQNNSTIALSEPISGAYIPAGGSGDVTFHDEAHMHDVLENLLAILEANYLPKDVLVVQPVTL